MFSEIKSRNMTAGNKGKVVFGSADMIATQRGWDMSISWNKACPGKDLLDSGSCQLTLACKSGQRFVNALALGVPAVGYAGYPSVQDACQGSEFDYVLLTMVRASDARGLSFANKAQRMCVCLSRAKGGLIFVRKR